MQLAHVHGAAVATIKHASLAGWRLLVVQPLAADGRGADGPPLLALDALGARRGDTVILSSDGDRARTLTGATNTPARVSVLGIQDPNDLSTLPRGGQGA